VRRMLGIFAAGRIVNPLTARSQFVGGMIWGISMALHEEAVRDRRPAAQVNRPRRLPLGRHADVPAIEADWVDDPDPDDPVGIKGIGEIGIVGARRRSPTPSGTRPAYATVPCRSAPTGS
jgi:xanthine dehydrogenase YagR molybdenum-binding subunit